MADVVTTLSPYRTQIAEIYSEICEDSTKAPDTGTDPVQTYDAFSTWAKGTGLWNDIAKGPVDASAVGVAYKRFLGGGINCPEGTIGKRRWDSTKTHKLISADNLPDDWQQVLAQIESPSPIPSWVRSRPLTPLQFGELNLTRDQPRPHDFINTTIDFDFNTEEARGFGINPGRRRVTIIRTPDGFGINILIDDGYIGSISNLDMYAAEVRGLINPKSLLDVWEEYVATILDLASKLKPIINRLGEPQEDGQHPLQSVVGDFLAPITSLFTVWYSGFIYPLNTAVSTAESIRDQIAADLRIEGSRPLLVLAWEYWLIKAQSEIIKGAASAIAQGTQSLTSTSPTGNKLFEIANSLSRLLDPFDILKSFASDEGIRTRIQIALPNPLPSIEPAVPSTLRLIIDKIVYMAGLTLRAAGAPIPILHVEWDAVRHTLSFISANALRAYEGVSGKENRSFLENLAHYGMGDGSQITFGVDSGNFRIDITVPLSPQGPPTRRIDSEGDDPQIIGQRNYTESTYSGFSGVQRVRGPKNSEEPLVQLLFDDTAGATTPYRPTTGVTASPAVPTLPILPTPLAAAR